MRWAYLIVALLGLWFAAGEAAAEPIVPRIILQQGHMGSVDAAAWTPDSRYLISAAATDRSLIVWDVADGAIVDRLRIPIFVAPSDFEPVKVASIAMAADGRSAMLTVFAARGRAGAHLAAARFAVTFDLVGRTLTLAGQPVVKEGAGSEGDYSLAALTRSLPQSALPNSPDGRYRLERLQAGGLEVARVDGTQRPRPLTGTSRGLFDDIDLSPDGSLMSRLVRIYGGGTTLIQLWDLRAGRALPTLIKATAYDRVRWIDPGRYLVLPRFAPAVTVRGPEPADRVGAAVGAQPPPPLAIPASLLVEARSAGGPRGEVSALIATSCMEAPLGGEGAMVAIGEGACAVPAVSDGRVLLHPAPRVQFPAIHPDDRWIERAVPGLAGRVVTAIAVSPVGDNLALATRDAAGVDGAAAPAVVLVDLRGAWSAKQGVLPSRTLPIAGVRAPDRMIVSDDGRLLIFATPAGVQVVTIADGATRIIPTGLSQPRPLASDGSTILVGGAGPQALERYSATDGAARPLGEAALGVATARFIAGKPSFWTASDDGTVRFWDSRNGTLIVTFVSFADNQFFAYTADGRYDTNLGPDSDALRWVVSDRPFQSLPAQTFMRQFYQPGLISLVLDCTARSTCATALKPIPSVADLDRSLPVVSIDGVKRGSRPYTAIVEVNAAPGAESSRDGPRLFDLRLFRNGQMVAIYPDRTAAAVVPGGDALAAWRAESAVPASVPGAAMRHEFTVEIPSDGRDVEFTAYAFNEDRVKGNTSAVFTYRPEQPPAPKLAVSRGPQRWEDTARPSGPYPTARERRAYIVAMGVNAYAIPGKSLRYAVNDSRALIDGLKAIPGYRVVPIALTADGVADRAAKDDIHAVLALLAGDEGAGKSNRARLAADGVDARLIQRATPDDLVILAFSGHGYAVAKSDFYILPSDARLDGSGQPIPSTMISSAELTGWLRRVDAGEMAMIIDACHSAASVDSGDFKPGPLGDPGLGQLAYDKGIRILAAAQANEEAQEDPALGQGLLTYTLVKLGLDAKHEGDFMLHTWLRGAAYNLVRIRQPATRPAKSVLAAVDDDDDPATPAQEPALFDFGGTFSNVVLRPAGSSPRP